MAGCLDYPMTALPRHAEPAKDSALAIPAEPLTGSQCRLARCVRLVRYAGPQRERKSRWKPHNGHGRIRDIMPRRAPARPARKIPVNANARTADICFVIMPFGEKVDLKGRKVKFDDIYAKLLAPAISNSGLQPVRCDELYESGLIQRKMLEHIRDARAAVVDISLLNANVFYELGVRHTLRKAVTVLVRRKGTSVPFNIGNMNVIEYDETDHTSLADAKSRIADFLVNGLRG